MRMRFATPGADYLASIGELAYGVSSLEWTLLGDLSSLSDRLPATLTTAALAGQTTGRIAGHLRDALPYITDPAVLAYISAGADALSAAATIRNDVLHARPATLPEGQRLYRWMAGSKAVAFPIDDAWMADALDELQRLSDTVGTVRPVI